MRGGVPLWHRLGAAGRRAAAVAAIIPALAAVADRVAATGLAVEGTDRAVVRPPREATVEVYENAGYRIDATAEGFVVAVETAPLESQTPFAAVAAGRAGNDPVARVARSITAGATTRYGAVSAVLAWLAHNIRYDLDRSSPQGAAEVLERRRGFCTGLARLAVAMLDSVGIPAREVPGYVAGSAGSDLSGYHRWVEVHYPDRGWAFSDPLHSHHYVPATYVRLASDRLDLGAGDSPGRLVDRVNRLEVVDVYPGAPTAITARRNHARQLASALSVRLQGADSATVALEGRGRRHWLTLDQGRGTFVDLAPGTYRLRIWLGVGSSFEREVRIDGAERRILHLPITPSLRGAGASR